MSDGRAWAAQVDLEVGEVNDRGLRGVKAARNMVEGQVAAKIPRALGAVMGDWNRTSEVGFLGGVHNQTAASALWAARCQAQSKHGVLLATSPDHASKEPTGKVWGTFNDDASVAIRMYDESPWFCLLECGQELRSPR